MKRVLRVLILSFIVMFTCSTAVQAQWVFLARKGLKVIQSVTSQVQGATTGQTHGAEAATVLLDVPADKVYSAAIKLIRENPDIQVLWQDDSNHAVGFSKGSLSGSLKVSSLAENLSQILVASVSTDTSGTAMMVERIMQVCRQAGVECSPE